MKDTKTSKEEIIKRYILLVIGLFFSAIGVAVTKRGDLGVSPISSAANVVAEKFSFFTLGNWLIVWNCILIVGQIVILRKNLIQFSCCKYRFPFCSAGLPISEYGALPLFPLKCIP